MISQWENRLLSSLLQLIDHEVCVKGKAFTNHSGTFYPIPSKYNGFYTYALPFKQIVSDASVPEATVMSGVSINNVYTTIGNNGFKGILHNKGQVLFDVDKGSSVITGSFAVKDYNIYLNNETEEDLLFKTKYQIAPKISQTLSGLLEEEKTYPAIFLKNMGGKNDPLALGGIDNVKTYVRAVVLSDSLFSLDAVCSILKNLSKKKLPILNSLPFNSLGAFSGVIYDYQVLALSSNESATIWETVITKLTPNTKGLQNLDWNIYSAFVDFEVHGIGKNI